MRETEVMRVTAERQERERAHANRVRGVRPEGEEIARVLRINPNGSSRFLIREILQFAGATVQLSGIVSGT